MCDSWPETGSTKTPSSSERRRARTNSSRWGFCRSTAAVSTVLETQIEGHDALTSQKSGSDEEQRAHQRRHRVSRQTKDERCSPDSEGERLPRLDGDAPEHLLDTQLGNDLANEVMGTHRNTAGGHQHIRLETALESRPVGVLVVFDHGKQLDFGARSAQHSRDHGPIRLVDLSRS